MIRGWDEGGICGSMVKVCFGDDGRNGFGNDMMWGGVLK